MKKLKVKIFFLFIILSFFLSYKAQYLYADDSNAEISNFNDKGLSFEVLPEESDFGLGQEYYADYGVTSSQTGDFIDPYAKDVEKGQAFIEAPAQISSNHFSPNATIATDVSGAFVDQFGAVRPDTASEAVGLAQEGNESSVVDITRTNADKAAIQKLNQGMQGLTGEQRQNYIKEHTEEYKQAGAISVFSGSGYGEVLVDKLPDPTTKVDYAVYGQYNKKGRYIADSPLTRDLVLSTYFCQNADVSTADIKKYTKLYQNALPPGSSFGFVGDGSAVEIAPGVYSTGKHVVEIDKHDSGDKIQLNGRELTIDKIVTADNDIAVFTTRENPTASQLKPGDSIPVIPFDITPVKKGDSLYFYGRDSKGAKPGDREVVGDYYGKINDEPWLIRGGVSGGFTLDFMGIPGQSGSGIYQKNASGNAILRGNIFRGVKRVSDDKNPPIDALFTPAEHTYKALDKLQEKYKTLSP
ncbi:MAG: hypothetical protein PHY94_06570 [Candidatus Omnitrophica bacterium]|nr:hypothetical protein [Candidatus Omnitrophota bacterium]